jgi:hypothetical protein
LLAFAESAHNAGYLLAQIDGSRIRPTPDGILLDGAAQNAAANQLIIMAESLIKLVQFLSIMLYVLVAGVMWGTWLS